MSGVDIKRRAQQLAAVSLKIKQFSKESKFDEISQIISQSQKFIAPSMSAPDIAIPASLLRDSQHTITSIVQKSPRRKQQPKNSARSPRFTEQIIRLQQQNVKIEEELRICKQDKERYREKCDRYEKQLEELTVAEKKLRDELDSLREIERKPFFEMHDVLWVHVSRLPIPADKVEGITFSQAKVTLKQEMVYLREKEIKKEFVLDHIARVLYYGNIMCVQVAGSGLVKDHYFFKFTSERMMKKWDRALYMNRKLSLCIDKEKLFQFQFPEEDKRGHYRNSVISEKMEEYEPSHNEIPPQTDQPIQYMKIEEGEDSLNKEINILDTKTPQKLDQVQEVISIPEAPPVIRYADSYLVPSLPQSAIAMGEIAYPETEPLSYPSFSAPPNPHNLPNIPTPISTIYQVPQASQPAHSIIQNLKPTESLQVPPTKPPRPSQLQRKTAVQNLRRGYVMTKYAKWGLNPHQKFVYLQPETMYLHWQDIKSKNDKKIPLASIIGFQQKIGEGMKDKAKKLDIQQCVVLQTKDRVLEFSSDSKEKMVQFLNDVDALLRSQSSQVRPP